MKNKHSITRWLLAAVLPALFLTACSKDNDATDYPVTPGPSGGDIRFEIGFAPQGGGAMNASADGSDVPQTRVATDALFNSTWEDGDEIGVFAVKAGEPLAASGNYIHNAKLTYSSATGTWTPAAPLYWPTKAENITALDFYAYYPYDASATDPTEIAFSVKTDQSGMTDGKSNYSLSDLLTAKAAGVSKNATVTLTFSHALAMVQVAIPGGKGWGGGSEGLAVTLRGVRPGATLNLGDIDTDAPGSGISVPTNENAATGITMYRMAEPSEGKYLYRALVPAQTVARGQGLFFFDNEGRQHFTDGALASALAMTAGQAEKFTRSLPAPVIATAKIPAGTFSMGSPGDEPDRYGYNETQHSVTLTKAFYMSKYEVTNSQYAVFLNAIKADSDGKFTSADYAAGQYPDTELVRDCSVSSRYEWGVEWSGDRWVPASGYEDHPVIYVTWYGAMEYARWVGGSLPTEAQWEYACRGGQVESLPFGIGDGTKLTDEMANFSTYYPYDISQGGQYNDESGTGYVGKTTTVGAYPYANGYGLYDMHGNVCEWCSDWYNYNYGLTEAELSGTVSDPTGPDSSTYRMLRGGSWFSNARSCRSAYRFTDRPDYADYDIGFRVVIVP